MTIDSNLSGHTVFTIMPESRVSWGIRIVAVFEAALIIATWRLWWGHSEFPHVPLLPIFAGVWLDRALTGLLLLSLFLIAVPCGPASCRAGLTRAAAMSGLIAGLVLAVLNQHRLQAWHWLFLLNLGWTLVIPGTARLTLMRHTICTIYVCSALSRFSTNPLSGMTGAIVYKSLAMMGMTGLTQNSHVPMVVSCAMTFAELLIGILLLANETHLLGSIGAMLLHLSLLIILGPLGLHHHAGALLWNLCFLCVIPALYWGRDDQAAAPSTRLSAATKAWIAAAWLFPLSGLLGLADNWPSWQLYSARPESWVLFIHDEDRDRLPESVADLIGDPGPLSEWCPVKIDRWSLERTGSPIYPQARFQLAIVEWILAHAPGNVRFQIEVTEPGTPFWWKRNQRLITTKEELRREHSRFILNSRAVQ